MFTAQYRIYSIYFDINLQTTVGINRVVVVKLNQKQVLFLLKLINMNGNAYLF